MPMADERVAELVLINLPALGRLGVHVAGAHCNLHAGPDLGQDRKMRLTTVVF